MTSDESCESRARSKSIIGGALLILFAAIALWAMRGLDRGTLRMIEPGGLPRAMALGIGGLGVIVLAGGLMKDRGGAVPPVAIRGTVVVLLSMAPPQKLGPDQMRTSGGLRLGAAPRALIS